MTGIRSGEDGAADLSPEASETLTRATVSSASWTALGQMSRQGMQVVTGICLARLLTPADFGVFAMVAAFSGFAYVLADLGLSGAVIQRADLRRAHLDAAFWSTGALGAVLAATLVLSAPLLAAFYDDPRVVGVTRLVAVAVLATSLAAVPRAVIARAMRFRALVVVEVSSAVVAAAVAVVAAAMGARFWAIPLQSVVAAVTATSALWIRGDWRPRWRIDRGAWRDLIGYGGYQAGFSSLNFWSRNADNLLIGRYVGPTDLGLYTRAYSLMLGPIVQVATVVGQVMFPAMSRINDDLPRVRRGYLAAVRLIALVTTPMLLGAAAAAPALIPAVLGHRWDGAVPLFQVLALAGAAQAIGTSVGWIYQSQGRTDLLFRWGILATFVTLVTFAVGVQWGAMGVAVGYTIQTYVLGWAQFGSAGPLIGLRTADILRATQWTLLGSALMAALVLGVGAAGHELNVGVLAVLQVSVGVVAYVVFCRIADAQALTDLRRVVAELRGRGTPA